MLFARSAIEAQVSEISESLQRLQRDHAQLLVHIDGEAALRRVIAGALHAAQNGATIGAALEGFASAMRRPLKRGHAGGLARASLASRIGERWPDGRFMAHSDWEQIEREVAEAAYMRRAAGGFARAASAMRSLDGTFAPIRVREGF